MKDKFIVVDIHCSYFPLQNIFIFPQMSNLIASYNRTIGECLDDVHYFLHSCHTECSFKFLFRTTDLHLKIMSNGTEKNSILLVPNYDQFYPETFSELNKRRFDILFFNNNSQKFLSRWEKNPYRKKILICSYELFHKFVCDVLVFVSHIDFILCDESHLINPRNAFLLSSSFKRVKKLYFSSHPSAEQRKKKYHCYNEMTFIEYETVDVPDDGNCFFHCLSRFLKKPHNDIRKECVDYFLNEKNLMKEYGLETENIKLLYEDGMWDTNEFDLLPKIASKLYKKTLFIHKRDSEFIETFIHESCKKPIYLSLKNYHYNIIVHREPTFSVIMKNYFQFLDSKDINDELNCLIPLKILTKHQNLKKK